MNIPNVNVAFPNTVAPSSSVAVHTGVSVTKDVLGSSFSPVSEISELSSSRNSLSESSVVYSPESLVRSSASAVSIDDVNTAPSSDVSVGGDINADATSENANNGDEPVVSDTSSSNQVVGEAPPSAERVDASVIVTEGGDESEAGEPAFIAVSGNSGQPQEQAGGLTPDELILVKELASRDQEVRTHEQQHQAVGGQHAGSASFSYQTGPDGVQYAVGGEVSIDISAVSGDPRATIDKMRTVQAAALAPAEPSSQDRSVAAAASRLMLQAQSDLASQQTEVRQLQAQETQEQRVLAQEERERQQDEQKGRRASISEGVRTYESLVGLGLQLENGLTPTINLDETV